MENKQIVKRMIDLQKKSFYNYFSIMVMLQDLTEKLLKNISENIPGLSDEGRKVMEQWNNKYKKNRDQCMKAIDDGYANIESFLNYNNAMVDLQEQAEVLLNNIFENIPGMSDEEKKVMEQWSGAYQTSRDDFMKTVDDGYAKVESLFDYNTREILKYFLPQDFKKSLEEMMAMHKKNRDEFKKFIGENIRLMESYSPIGNKSQIDGRKK